MNYEISVAEMQTIIRKLEEAISKVIGTKDEHGILVSLREDSQRHLLESLCRSIDDRLNQTNGGVNGEN